MTNMSVDTVFRLLDEAAISIQQEKNMTYLEALVETAEHWYRGDIQTRERDETLAHRLQKHFDTSSFQSVDPETMRKGMQLAVLKGMKEGIQPHHEMTPDAISLFLAYLLNKWMKGTSSYRLLDPAIGTGNLMLALMNHADGEIAGYGVEADELLLKLASIGANLQQHPLELFHGDSVQPLYVDPVDAVVCDLPVGYYPNDEIAKAYTTAFTTGHSYVHHLLIEQSLHYLKPGGIALFLIPNFLFESEGSQALRDVMKHEAYIQGVLQLPTSMFKKEQHSKSILMLQKKGNDAKQGEPVLLAELPSFTNESALSDMMGKINEWFNQFS